MKKTSYKKGLVLEGGAMRGMFTCGVLDVFMENGIVFDGAAGISAGAAFGCNYKSHQPGRAIRYNKKYSKDKRYCSKRSLIFTGDLYGADFCYREIPFKLDPFDVQTYIKDPMEFYVGATDTSTGKPVFHNCINMDEADMLWIRASASMPIVSKSVKVDGYELLDGGISDPIPFRFMEDKGYNRNIIVLTQPDGYIKKRIKPRFLYGVLLKDHPSIMEAMSVRHVVYNNQIREIKKRETEGSVLVIRPSENLGINRVEKDPSELERVYQIGRNEALKRLDDVKDFLK